MSSSVLIAIGGAAVVLVAGLIALELIPRLKRRGAPQVLRSRLWRAVPPGRSRQGKVVTFPIVPQTEGVREGVVDANSGQPAGQRSVIERLEIYGVPKASAEAVASGSSTMSAAQPAEPPPTSLTAAQSESRAPEPATFPIAVDGAVAELPGWNDELVTLIERMKECRHALSLLVLHLEHGNAPPEGSAIVDALPAQIAAGYGRAEARVWLEEPDLLFLALPGVLPRRAIALCKNLPLPFADISSDGRDSIVAFGVAGFPRDARSARELVVAARRSMEVGAARDLNLSRARTVSVETEAPALEVWTSRS